MLIKVFGGDWINPDKITYLRSFDSDDVVFTVIEMEDLKSSRFEGKTQDEVAEEINRQISNNNTTGG